MCLFSIQLHSLIFSKGPLLYYLLKGLFFNGLVENREKTGIRGRERKASHAQGTRWLIGKKQCLRVTASDFILEKNYTGSPLPTPYLTVKLKTRATPSAEGQSFNRSPFMLAVQTWKVFQQVPEDLNERGTAEPWNRRKIIPWSVQLYTSTIWHLAMLAKHTKCWQQHFHWPKTQKVSLPLWGWEIHLCYHILVSQFLQ